MTYESDSQQMEAENSPSATLSDQKRPRSEITSTPPKEKKKKKNRRQQRKTKATNSNTYAALASADDELDDPTRKLDFTEAQDQTKQTPANSSASARTATSS